MSISPASMGLERQDHEAELGYGRLVMLFKCWFNVKEGAPDVQRDLAFIEEFWRKFGLTRIQVAVILYVMILDAPVCMRLPPARFIMSLTFVTA